MTGEERCCGDWVTVGRLNYRLGLMGGQKSLFICYGINKRNVHYFFENRSIVLQHAVPFFAFSSWSTKDPRNRSCSGVGQGRQPMKWKNGCERNIEEGGGVKRNRREPADVILLEPPQRRGPAARGFVEMPKTLPKRWQGSNRL